MLGLKQRREPRLNLLAVYRGIWCLVRTFALVTHSDEVRRPICSSRVSRSHTRHPFLHLSSAYMSVSGFKSTGRADRHRACRAEHDPYGDQGTNGPWSSLRGD